MDEKMSMPFGKHKGKDMEDVPAEYLYWASQQDWIASWPGVAKYIKDNIKGIKKELGLPDSIEIE